jgi:thiol-disulfide isomerase/thioredoxin
MSAVKAQFQRFANFGTALVLLAGLALGYLLVQHVYAKERPVPGALPALSFVDRAGNPADLSQYRGKVVLVNLWATWCPPCVAELPSLEILHARLRGQGFAVVALSLDRGSVEKVAAFWDKRGIEQLDFFWDRDGLVPRRWSYEAIPTSYLLDRTGRVVKTYAGAYKWDEPEIFGEIERQVKEGTE